MKNSWLSVAITLLASCSADSRYFDAVAVDAYELGFAIIAASRVDEVSFSSNGETIFGVFVQSPAVDAGNALTAVLEAVPASSDALVDSALDFSLPGSFFFDETFDNTVEIQRVTAPILLMHGTADEEVPFENHAVDLFHAAPSPKQEAVVSGAHHEDIPQTLGEAAYRQLVEDFVLMAQ
jgi:fermentation-respiration switch protein FrsA (DUF1100 family)